MLRAVKCCGRGITGEEPRDVAAGRHIPEDIPLHTVRILAPGRRTQASGSASRARRSVSRPTEPSWSARVWNRFWSKSAPSRLRDFPSDLTLEIRENSLQGSVTQRWGNAEAMGSRVLVKTALGFQRYRPRGQVHVPEPGGPVPLLTALFDTLKPHERLAMGFPSQSDARQFNAALASLAAGARQESARVLGLQPIRPGFKHPVTLPGGQIGYPLCGLGAGAYSAALQRRVRDIYPEFDNDQVVTYLEDLIEGGLDPLRILRERKRERKALMASLQSWVDAAPDVQPGSNPVHDYSENRYRVAFLIARSWSKSPKHLSWANPDEVYSLNLDGFRLDEFPTLPDVADLSHVPRSARHLLLNT